MKKRKAYMPTGRLGTKRMGELAELAWRPNLGTIQSSSDAGVAWEDAALHLLSNKRGEIAELIFMRKAVSLGFRVAKPWGNIERYDFILNAGELFWRVQVKSVWASP